ncbi:MAG: hypothetical protein WAT51_15180, partial [Holophaga sp.]
MTRANRTIGVFDSGIGGLTVVRALRQLLPGESITYLGDTARLPYGTFDLGGGFGARFNHPHHRARAGGLQGGQTMGTGGIAGHDDELGLIALEDLAHLQ